MVDLKICCLIAARSLHKEKDQLCPEGKDKTMVLAHIIQTLKLNGASMRESGWNEGSDINPSKALYICTHTDVGKEEREMVEKIRQEKIRNQHDLNQSDPITTRPKVNLLLARRASSGDISTCLNDLEKQKQTIRSLKNQVSELKEGFKWKKKKIEEKIKDIFSYMFNVF